MQDIDEMLEQQCLEYEEYEGGAALHIAVCDGDWSRVLELLEGGADPNMADGRVGMRPIHLAAGFGDCTCIAFLVAFGVDLDGKDNMGNVALHYASREDNVEAFEYLMRLGADIRLQNNCGKCVLDGTSSVWIIYLFGEYAIDLAERSK